jgi:S-adenosylmethionine:tRNA ribosyltransferase-isomerase
MTTRRPYRLSDFDFDLPSELIAQVPAPERSGSRLLHVAGARLVDLVFGALPELLVPGDLLVFNDTRVVRSRIVGRKPSGGRVELMLERIVAPCEAWMQLRASHPPRVGAAIELPGGASAMVCERDERFFRLRFDVPTTLADYLEHHGAVPLPPYIARAPEPADAERYQTVYARHPGAVAAPTAGLHFDHLARRAAHPEGRLRLRYAARRRRNVLPVESDDLSQHRMHSERFSIPRATLAAIDETAAGAAPSSPSATSRALEAAAAGSRSTTKPKPRCSSRRASAFASSIAC